MKTPDLGHFTRSVIQQLENIKFTPSQGICTPSPTIMVHHHHHVYGALAPGAGHGGVQEDQISSAYLAGLAAGRAESKKANTGMIPTAMYEVPSAKVTDEAPTAVEEMNEEEENRNDDAKSLDGDAKNGHEEHARNQPRAEPEREPPVSQVPEWRRNGCAGGPENINEGKSMSLSRSRSASPTKSPRKSAVKSPAKQGPVNPTIEDEDNFMELCFALLVSNGIRSVERREDVPGAVIALASLLITLNIPAELVTMPADEFCGGVGSCGIRLNSRQRRTLRRSQERAWKEMEQLKGELATGTATGTVNTGATLGASHYVRRSYSPTCLNYGVQPTALAEYNAYMVAGGHGMIPMASAGAYVQPVAFAPMHPQMANFVPAHGAGHQYHGSYGHHGQHGVHFGHHARQHPRTKSRLGGRGAERK